MRRRKLIRRNRAIPERPSETASLPSPKSRSSCFLICVNLRHLRIIVLVGFPCGPPRLRMKYLSASELRATPPAWSLPTCERRERTSSHPYSPAGRPLRSLNSVGSDVGRNHGGNLAAACNLSLAERANVLAKRAPAIGMGATSKSGVKQHALQAAIAPAAQAAES